MSSLYTCVPTGSQLDFHGCRPALSASFISPIQSIFSVNINFNFRCKFPDENDTWPFALNQTAYNQVNVSLFGSEYCQTTEGSGLACPNGHTYDRSEITNSATSRVSISFLFLSEKRDEKSCFQWDVVCSDRWIKPVVQSMYYVGQLIGSLFFGWLGDRYGRKICLIISLILMTAAGITMAFVPHWSLFGLLRMV